MGVILRTAGASRTKAEVKRDFEYLLRMWEQVPEMTLKSTAPTLVYQEGSLIKRAIRDLFNKDIDEVIVSGDNGYREAKEFMRMLMPSHAKNVQPYRDAQPVFAKSGVEAQLDAMFTNHVTLKSGGYLVINQTLKALTKYGERIGLAFQITDDILNVEGYTEELGKAAGSDAKMKKMTYPAFYGIEKSRQEAENLVAEAIDALVLFPPVADPLRTIAHYLVQRRA